MTSTIRNGLDLIDLLGPDATRQDYENIRDLADSIIKECDWNDDGSPRFDDDDDEGEDMD